RLGENLGCVTFRVLPWLISQPRGAGVIPVAARIRGNAPHEHEAEVGYIDRTIDQVEQIVEAEPRTQVTELGRLLDTTADPDTDALDAVLVPVQAGQTFSPHFAEAVKAVGTEVAVEAELRLDRMHADRMVRAGEHDALHAVTARAFVHFDECSQIVLDDLGQWPFHARTR